MLEKDFMIPKNEFIIYHKITNSKKSVVFFEYSVIMYSYKKKI